MDPETWKRIDAILDEAFERPEAERAGYVEEACAGDPSLRARIEALLAADSREKGLLDTPVDALAGPLIGVADEDADALPAGTLIPPYRIVREIGRGGMGRVYLAERADGQFEQQVALKLVRAGLAWGPLRDRFLQERQILAGLQHPHIARLLDGGVTGDGRPYFAMEYVEGSPITTFAEQEELTTDARLELFADICDAVAYAQRRLVVHRDLKPSNVLVTAERQVKLLDFGIAKLLGTSDEESATREGMRLLTPEYAAPEQVEGEAVTTATDVFALGRMLSELLSDGDSLRGDLLNIVGKALATEPERRYGTAADLGEDLRRFRAGLPIEARAPSWGYRARRFVARNALGVAATGVVLLTLVAGLVATTWQARRAERQAERATQVTGFLAGLFDEADPDLEQGSETTAAEILLRGANRIETELAGDPDLQAELFEVIGRILTKRGAYTEAAGHLERALALHTDLHGASDPRVAGTLAALGEAHLWGSEYERAEGLFERALEIERGRRRGDPVELARAIGNMASIKNQLGKFDEAEPLYREALAIDRAALGERHLDVATDLSNLGGFLREQGRLEEAEAMHLEVLEIRREQLPARHSAIALTLHNLGYFYSDGSDYEQAEKYLREAVEMRRHLYQREHPRLASSLRVLGSVLQRLGRLDEAQALLEESLEQSRGYFGDVHTSVASCFNDIAVTAFMRGDLEGAREGFAESLATFRQLLPEDHPNVLTLQSNLGAIALQLGDLDEAERIAREILAVRRAKYGDEHPSVAGQWIGLGRVHGRRGDWVAAREAYEQALAIYRGTHEETNLNVAEAKYYLGRALGELARHGKAEELLREILARYEDEFADGHRRIADARLELGRLLDRSGRPAEALPLLESAEASRRAAYGDTDWRTGEAVALRGICLASLGRRDEARGALEEGIAVLRDARGPQEQIRRAEDVLADLR